MSSSIEEYFQPPEWATKEEVIKAAQHYINYWRIEAKHSNSLWLAELETSTKLRKEIEHLKKCDKFKIYRDGEWHTVWAIPAE